MFSTAILIFQSTSIFLFFFPYIYLSTFIYLSIFLPVCVSISPSIQPSIHQPIYLSIFPSFSMFLFFSFSSDSLSGEESKRTPIHIGDTVKCVANSSQSCTYKWVWYEKVGNDISRTIESSDHVLIAGKIGLHRCEAQCDLRNQFCLVFPKFIFVIPSGNSPGPIELPHSK